MVSQLKDISIGTAATITVLLVNLAAIVWLGGSLGEQVEQNTRWRNDNRGMPACVERNEAWIRDNKSMPQMLARQQAYLETFIGSITELKGEMKDLSTEIRRLTEKFNVGPHPMSSENGPSVMWWQI